MELDFCEVGYLMHVLWLVVRDSGPKFILHVLNFCFLPSLLGLCASEKAAPDLSIDRYIRSQVPFVLSSEARKLPNLQDLLIFILMLVRVDKASELHLIF